jgi:hypothetical protein
MHFQSEASMKHSVVLLVVLAGCGRSEVSPVIPVPAEPPLRILFYGDVDTRKDGGETDSFYQATSAIPGEPSELNLKGEPITVSLISATRDSAAIRVGYRDESREVTIGLTSATDVLFDADAVKVSIRLGTTSLAPFAPNDPIFNSHVMAHKIDNGISPVPIKQHKVLARREVTPDQARRLRNVLTGNQYLALDGAMCFEPGLEFVFGTSDDAIHVVVCLECCKIHIATADEKKLDIYYGLNKAGVAEFKALYEEIF